MTDITTQLKLLSQNKLRPWPRWALDHVAD